MIGRYRQECLHQQYSQKNPHKCHCHPQCNIFHSAPPYLFINTQNTPPGLRNPRSNSINAAAPAASSSALPYSCHTILICKIPPAVHKARHIPPPRTSGIIWSLQTVQTILSRYHSPSSVFNFGLLPLAAPSNVFSTESPRYAIPVSYVSLIFPKVPLLPSITSTTR